jgi:hypothetical protein
MQLSQMTEFDFLLSKVDARVSYVFSDSYEQRLAFPWQCQGGESGDEAGTPLFA